MTASPYADSVAAVAAAWASGWPAPSGVPVLWHHNGSDAVPSRVSTQHWLHLAVEHSSERLVAFGAGRGAHEKELHGSVVIRVMAARGLGEATQLALLDQALGVFRSRRDGPLSFLGTSVIEMPGASADGAWWVRSGIAVFVYRFRG